MTFWIAGFDLLYALQDLAFDRSVGLHSFPARRGVGATLWLSAGAHGLTVFCLAAAARSAEVGGVFSGAVALVAAALVVEHLLVRPGDLSRLNAAFFTTNGFIAVGLLAAGALDSFLA